MVPPLLSCGLHVASFISPKVSGEREAVWSALAKAGRPPQPTNFQTLDGARYSLDRLCASIVYDRIKANVDIFEDDPPLSENFNARRYAPDLQTWSDALERMLPDYLKTKPPVCHTFYLPNFKESGSVGSFLRALAPVNINQDSC